MLISINRHEIGDDYTLGTMSIDGLFLGYTLEDKDRKIEEFGPGAKVPKKTAIPRGRYEVILSYSNRFKCIMPEVLGVQHFIAIRIHGGNTVEDTEGCPLLGSEIDGHTIRNCAGVNATLRRRMMQAAERHERVWLEVK